jgi:2-oxoglutarate dehydrogenase complex dehydrogenase (E1) component-like enzyme
VEAREKQRFDNVAIVCVDQYYPLRNEAFSKTLQDYAAETPVRWVQEEPENMGAWPFWKNRFCHRIVDRFPFSVVARSASASPATGSSAAHKREHEELIARAFKAPS